MAQSMAMGMPCMLTNNKSFVLLRAASLISPSLISQRHIIRCSQAQPDDSTCSTSFDSSDQHNSAAEEKWDRKILSRSIISAVAVGLLLMPLGEDMDAMAAPSGGRIGGQAFRSAPRSPPRSAPPPSSGPRINNSRTNVYINPGYSYGSPFFGGWGWSPFSFYAPGPSIAVGVGGFDFLPFLLFVGFVGFATRIFRRRDRDDYD